LAPAHPINKLLRPHFRHQLGINTLARKNLFADKGITGSFALSRHCNIFEEQSSSFKYAELEKLMIKAFSQWRFDQCSFPEMLKARNITPNPEDLPGYYYRDDGQLIWNALSTYTKSVISTYYTRFY
jgi:arachidonate 5-lipoxygenase